MIQGFRLSAAARDVSCRISASIRQPSFPLRILGDPLWHWNGECMRLTLTRVNLLSIVTIVLGPRERERERERERRPAVEREKDMLPVYTRVLWVLETASYICWMGKRRGVIKENKAGCCESGS